MATSVRPAILENDVLHVAVAPAVGGRVVSLVHRATGREFLWRNPRLSLAPCAPGSAYDPNFYGGMDEVIDRTFRTVAKREGRIIDGFSMGGYGAARRGFKHPHLFAAVSLLGAGPLQAEFTEAPRAGPRERDRLLNTVYGGDMAYYRQQSPWHIVEQNAERLRTGLLIRQIVGDRDETLGFNREFKQHLDALKIPHSSRQLPGIPHDPNLVLNTLGEDNWEFYRSALSPKTTIRTQRSP